jgi:uncharacterized protein YqjF (DUF2071 family)
MNTLPRGPWIMAQRWSDLLFAHWPVDAAALRPLVPSALPLDTFDGRAWISIASFHLGGLRPRWLPPMPWLSEFPELNVRTYTSLGGKPGVYFFSLDAGSAFAVAGARATYFLPYFRASMNIRRGADGWVYYDSRRTDPRGQHAAFHARYRPTGAVSYATPGSLDYWLTERYALYAVNRSARVFRADIHHPQWPLQPVEAIIEHNSMAAAAGISIPNDPPRLAFASRIDVVVWRPLRVA